MSRILTADSQKLSLSILRKVPFLIFWSDKPCRRTNSAHVAWSRAGTWAAWAEVVHRRGVFYVDKIYILKSSWKIVRNMFQPAKSDEIVLQVGTPNLHNIKTVSLNYA